MSEIETKEKYTFKFFKIRFLVNPEYVQYSMFSNSQNLLSNIIANVFVQDVTKLEYKKDKIVYFDIIEKNDDIVLGKYSVSPSKNCLYARNRDIDNLSENKIEKFATNFSTYFYIDLKTGAILFLENSETKGFLENIRKVMKDENILIDIDITNDWQNILKNSFKEINKIEIRIISDNNENEHFSSIKKIGLPCEYFNYEKSSFKVKPIKINTIVDDIAKTDIKQFEILKVRGKTDSNIEKSVDILKDYIHKKKEAYFLPSQIYNYKDAINLVEIFKSIVN